MMSLSPFSLVLPYPPTVNTYWRRTRKGMRRSDAANDYRLLVRMGVKGVTKRTGRLAVSIDVHQPDRRERDIDNILKGLLDSLQHAGVYQKDAQIDDLRVRRCGVDREHPRVEVTILETPST